MKVSNCCCAPPYGETHDDLGFCSECMEHAVFEGEEDEDLFCRDYYEEIWSSYIKDESEEIDDDIIIDSFIEVMEREVMEIDIHLLYGEKKPKEKE